MDQPTSQLFNEAVKMNLLQATTVLLLALHSRHGAGYKPSELSRATGVSTASLSYSKRELMAAGLLEERHPYRDQRATKYYLTDAGKKMASQLWETIKGLSAASDGHFDREVQ